MLTLSATKAIELRNIGKKYPLMNTLSNDVSANLRDFWALKDINLEVNAGQIVGIIGRNGAGKTTLLNIIAGILSPTQGQLCVGGRVIGLFNLGVGFQDELSGKENIFLNGAILGASKKELDERLSSIIDFSELGNFINMPIGSYSQGMRLRLGFSIIANLDFDILVIDEVLAVGDSLFQSKCFERLMDFKRSGKTLAISTQGMDLIERLCDKVALLDHGHLLFFGEVVQGINRYRALLSSEKFFVGPEENDTGLVKNTKKWADGTFDWGKKFGTKEITIESVELRSKFGFKCDRIKSGEPLKIKAHFTAKNSVKEPHFGVAIFRNDGVYCYGPNTRFDGYRIPAIRAGKGWFSLSYKKVLLAPGEYRFSVAIWDKNETLAFDHHNGYYALVIKGSRETEHEVCAFPFRTYPKDYLISLDIPAFNSNPGKSNEGEGQKTNDTSIKIKSFRLLDIFGKERKVFKTNESVMMAIDLGEPGIQNQDSRLRVGIYRDDGIYCQGATVLIAKKKELGVLFPKFPLLPGGYVVRLGTWGIKENRFLMDRDPVYAFNMVFERHDHGTVYLEHKWKWKLP